ncbi:hypothetical protein ACWGNF_33140 [Streptomyces sp. NPDC055808]
MAAKTAAFAGDLEQVSGALSAYSEEVRPLAKKLEDLQRQAYAFTASIEGDDHWRRDEKRRDRNDGLKDEANATLQAFYEAETACHDKITALLGARGRARRRPHDLRLQGRRVRPRQGRRCLQHSQDRQLGRLQRHSVGQRATSARRQLSPRRGHGHPGRRHEGHSTHRTPGRRPGRTAEQRPSP